jgi:nucleotide-binding universal stress UspA family protein
MFGTIIVPLDGSELAETVLARAVELARKFEGQVILLQAVDSLAQRQIQPPAMMESPSAAAANFELLERAMRAEKEAAEVYLSTLRDRLKAEGVKVEAIIAEGDAADSILKLAEEQNADLIAMSTHGRGGLGRLVFGSVADAVLRRTHCPILLLRPLPKE